MTQMIKPGSGSFDEIWQQFRWELPEQFNMGMAVCDRHSAYGDRVALYYENEAGVERQFTFADLKRDSDRLANVLQGLGIKRGDRIASALPQRVEAGLVHIAAYKIGAIMLPLSVLFREEAARYRLEDSGARIVITDAEHRPMYEHLTEQLPSLERVIDCDDLVKERGSPVCGFWPLLDRASESFSFTATGINDPALLIYTSGTTGQPKGALSAQRCLLGTLPGFELSHDFFPEPDDLFWTPADWAWTGGLLDALLPSWYYGVPVLAYECGRFDPEKTCHILQKYGVRNSFIPPTALKMLRQMDDLRGRYDLKFRSIMSAGETLGAEVWEWTKEQLGVEANEMCGQTECNYIVGNSASIMDVKPGSMGKSYPGHRVDPVDADGNVMAVGETGELAALRDDPVMFLGYWNREQATLDNFRGDYWSLGDVCYRDADGYLWFVGRDDDVISTAGYRVGPGEVEDSLLKHPAVAAAAVIGVPDDLRGQIVKAYVVVASGVESSDDLADDIRQSVKDRLAAHEYPRALEFVSELPMTTTGKIRRIELRERHAEKNG